MNSPIYLDHAATTPLDPEVRAAVLPWLGELFGNPSSAHGHGRRARAAVDEARDRVAVAAGCASREVILTSGGTEADNLALRGVLERWGAERGRHLVVSAVEHEAVLATARGLAEAGRSDLTVVDCDRQGRIDPAAVAAAVRPDTVLVSVMLANNEVGTVQDVPAITAAVRARNSRTLVHTDAVQALGGSPSASTRSGWISSASARTRLTGRRAWARWWHVPASSPRPRSPAAARSVSAGPVPRTSPVSWASARPPSSPGAARRRTPRSSPGWLVG